MIKVQILLEINGTQLALSMEDAKELAQVLADLTGSKKPNTFTDPTVALYRGDGLNEKVEAARERAHERTSGCGTEKNVISKEMLKKHREEMQEEIDKNREKLFEMSERFMPGAMPQNKTETMNVGSGCGTKGGGCRG